MLRFEAWSLPASGTFEHRFTIDQALAGSSGVVELSAFSDGRLVLPAGYPRLSDIVSPTTGTLIRVFNDTQLVDEFRAERVPRGASRPGTVTVTGTQINGVLRDGAVYPYRWPNDSEGAPDWHWGLDENLLTNPSAEDNPYGIGDPGFESGLAGQWRAGAVDGVHAQLFIQTDDPRTGVYYMAVAAMLSEGGASITLPVTPGRSYRFAFYGKAHLEDSEWQLGASGPPTIMGLDGAVVRATSGGIPGLTHEAQVEYVFGQTDYEQLALSFTAGPEQTSTQISIRYLGPDPMLFRSLKVDDCEWGGFGVGVDGWVPSPGATAFAVSDTAATPTDGDWVFVVGAEAMEGAYQSIGGMIPGDTVTVEVDIPSGVDGHTWALELRDLRGNRLGQHAAMISDTTNTHLAFTTILPDHIPDGVVQVWVVNRMIVNSSATFDNARLRRGLPEASATEILRLLIEACQARGALTYIDLDFTDLVDTAGSSVPKISLTATFGTSLDQVAAALKQMGYEWRVKAKPVPVGGFTHDLQLWAPGSTIGDLTAVPGGPSILAGAHVVDAEVVSRHPPFTSVMVHGAGSLRVEDTNPATEAALGRIERVVDAETVASSTGLQSIANAMFAEEEANREALSANVAGTNPSVPLVDYEPGQTVWWQFPGLTGKTAKPVRRISWTHGPVATYEVQGSRILTPEAGITTALDFLLSQRSRRGLDRTTTFSQITETRNPGGGTTTTPGGVTGARIHLAATVQEVEAGGGPVVWSDYLAGLAPVLFAHGSFPVDRVEVRQVGYYNINVRLDWDTWTGGGVVRLIRERDAEPDFVWLPPNWSGTDGQRFIDTAHALPFRPGDTLRVVVDHGDGSPHDLAGADFAMYHVGGEGPVLPPNVLVFTEDGTFDWAAAGMPSVLKAVHLVGGGGCGGGNDNVTAGGGGGGGRYRLFTSVAVSGNVAVTVGDGATAITTIGASTLFGALEAEGGGNGSRYDGDSAVIDGGSGGGGGSGSGSNPVGVAGTGMSPGGHKGGEGYNHTASNRASGGGGGAGGAGGDAGHATPGPGGVGIDLSHIVGTAYGDLGNFAGGGGGVGGGPVAPGGVGGGGDGSGTAGPGEPGMVNTGGGGGGATGTLSGNAPGGSGIAIVEVAA